MPTPNFDARPTEVEWSIQSDYSLGDNGGRMICAMTGFPKRDGEVVYKGPHIDDFEGFFVLGQDSVEQLAKLAGFVDPDDYDEPGAELVAENEALREENEKLREQLAAVTEAVSG